MWPHDWLYFLATCDIAAQAPVRGYYVTVATTAQMQPQPAFSVSCHLHQSKQNTPNKKTPGAKSVIDITNSPASKKKSPKKKSAAKTTPCVVDLSKDKVSGKKGSAKKTPKTTTEVQYC